MPNDAKPLERSANYITEYHTYIQSNPTSEYIHLLYNNLVAGIKQGLYIFNAKRAAKVIKFIELFCHHSKGRNDLLKLELWQKAMISAIFGIQDRAGLRFFKEIFIVIGRKNGKSILASAIIAVCAFFDNEYGAEIYCLAPRLDQANIVFNENFYEMLKQEPELFELAKKRKNDIYIEGTNTIIKPIAFNYKKSDGYNPHLVINDELAQWPARTGLRQYGVMKSAIGARKQPLIVSITTAGDVNDGIFDDLFTRSTHFFAKQNAGFLLDSNKDILPFIYMIDDAERWDDIEEIKKANPNIGISVFEQNFKDDIAIARHSLPAKSEFLMKHCNIKQNSTVAWLDFETVACATSDYTLNDFRGHYCVGGIDLSQYTDLTAACVIIEKAGILYAFTQFFMPEGRIIDNEARDNVPYSILVKKGILTISGENKINYKDILKWFLFLEDEYKLYIQKIGYDRNLAAYLIDDLKEQGFHTDDVHQGENLTPVIKEFEGIIKDKHFKICNNNTLLQSHFLNVALKTNTETRRVRPVKIEPRAKIDGFVSVICAMTVRQKYWPEVGEYLTNN